MSKICKQIIDEIKPLYSWKVPSKGEKGKFWTIEWSKNRLTCDCPAFTNSGKKKFCKHIQLLYNYYDDKVHSNKSTFAIPKEQGSKSNDNSE